MQSEGEPYEPPFSDDERSRAGSEEEASDISDEEHPVQFPPVQQPGVENAGNPTPFREATASKRQLESLHKACREVRDAMEDRGTNLPIFLDEISWGSDASIDDGKIRYQRTVPLFQSIEPQTILAR